MPDLLHRPSCLLNRLSCRVLAFMGWVVVEDTRVWRYLENTETGRRHVLRIEPGDEPIDNLWLVNTRTISLEEEWPWYDG
jgi:hypothetical protein